MGKIPIIIFLVFLSNLNLSQISNSEKIYNAYINNDLNAWKYVIYEMETNKTKDVEYVAELLNFQYGYISMTMEINQKKEAKRYLELAKENLEFLKRNNWNKSMVNTYLSAFYAIKIGLRPLRAPFLGPKSMNHAKEAIKADNRNPMAYLLMGKNYYFMPATFGGSKIKAVEYYSKAEQLYEESTSIKSNWNYLSLLITTAEIHEEMEDYETANSIYSKILVFEPDFTKVKNKLAQRFENK